MKRRRRYLSEGSTWQKNAVSWIDSDQARLEELKKGWYGRCVYFCDNDVVDHQSVNMELDDGAIVTLVMQGQSDIEGRTMQWDGTRATL